MSDSTNAGDDRPQQHEPNTPARAPAPLMASTISQGRNAFIPDSFESAIRLASMFSKAGEMVPAHYRGNPEAAMAAILWGMELGITPIQAIQGIAVIKGRAAVWGDLLLALVKTHPDFVSLIEEPMVETAPDGKQVVIGYRATCTRRNQPPVVREFTIADAARAGLTNKDTPWKTYPERMCMMRARSWACRDCLPDALRGLYSAEEANDIIDVTPTRADDRPQREPIREPQARQEPAPATRDDDIVDAEFREDDPPPLQLEQQGNMLDGLSQAFAQEVDRDDARAEASAPAVDNAAAAAPAPAPAPVASTPGAQLTPTMRQTLQTWIDKAAAMGMKPAEFDAQFPEVTVSNLAKAITFLRSRA